MLKNCEWCGKDFDANVSYQIYCTAECRTVATKKQYHTKAEAKESRITQR